jgi:hypothetical protein
METSKLQVRKIIEQEVKPNESLIIWTDVYMKYIKKTFQEQVTAYAVEPDTAKQRIIAYVTERLQNELVTS